MEHAINIPHSRRHGALVGDVPHRGRQRQRINPTGVIVGYDQDRDVVPTLNQCFTEMAAEEDRTAGYKYLQEGNGSKFR